jgi:hypothetical protein
MVAQRWEQKGLWRVLAGLPQIGQGFAGEAGMGASSMSFR